MATGETELEILHCDDDCIAINKPPGLFVHASPREPRSRPNAVAILSKQIGQRVLPVHRLDRATSGVLLFALNSRTAREFSESFRNGLVEKEYLAIVRGHTDDADQIDKPLKRHTDGLDDPDWGSAASIQPAITEYVTLGRCEIPVSAGHYPSSRYSLVRVKPRTGRRHQIRRHFNSIAHPILGDTRHGDHRHNKLIRREFGLARLMLAATRMRIPSPADSGTRLVVQASPGQDFEACVQVLGFF